MHKINRLAAISLAFSLLAFSACGTADELNAETSSNSVSTGGSAISQIQLPEKYTVLFDMMGQLSSVPEAKSDIEVKGLNADFYIGTGTDYNDKSPTEKEKSFSINGKNYDVSFEKTRTNELYDSEDPLLSKCGIWYEYEGNNSSDIEVSFNEEGKLVFLSDLSVDRNIDGDFSEEDAKILAEEIVKDLYGNDILEKYSVIETDTIETNKQTRVFYYKKVADRVVDEFIMVVFNRKGELCAINAITMGYFDPLAERITEEHITSAESKLLEAFPTYSIVDDEAKMIVIDAKGQYYLCQNIRSETEKKSYFLFINLE